MSNIKDYNDVMKLVCTGTLKVAVDKVYPLQEARAAQERLAGGEQLGKIVLEI
jgi:NADPH:quinone reductase-like Zn-dependent oxidoreductase